MDITGALLKGILKEPIDNIYDVLVVGIRLLHRAQFKHRLQVSRRSRTLHAPGSVRATHGARHRIKLCGMARNFSGISEHPANRFAQHMLQVCFPDSDVRVAAGDYHLIFCYLNRENTVALSECSGHHLGNGTQVYFQRVNIINSLPRLIPKPS